MFICTLRATTLKLFGVILLGAALLVGLLVAAPARAEAEAAPSAAEAGETTVTFDKVKTNEDRIRFLSQFGWTVSETPEEEEVRIPAEFDRVFAGYNEIQKRQGLDLSKYAGRKVMRYTYAVSNYPDAERKVYATVIVYRNRVIGGDLCAPGRDSFVLQLNGEK